MNLIPFLLRLGLAIGVICALPSCEVYGPYPGGGYVSDGYAPAYASGGYASRGYVSDGDYYDDGYDDWDTDYYSYYPPAYPGYVSYSLAYPHYYGGRYYSYRWWNDDHYRSYRHDHRDNRRRHTAHRNSDELKIVRTSRGGRTPQGYHSREWYQDRGYNLRGTTFRDRDGDLHGRQSQSRQSNNRDDDRRRALANRSNANRSVASRIASRPVASRIANRPIASRVASHRGSDRNVTSHTRVAHSSPNRSHSARQNLASHSSANRGSAHRPSGGHSRYSHPSNASRGGSNRGERSSSGDSDDGKRKKK
jgi:hypothetical protein